MSPYEPLKIHLNLSKKEAEYLLKALENEWERWDDLIVINHSPAGNLSIAADYEYDSIRLDDLITEIKFLLHDLKTFMEISFGYTEAAFIIAALDHEFDAHHEKKSSFLEEEFNLIMEIRKQIVELGTERFGDGVLTVGHYQRGT